MGDLMNKYFVERAYKIHVYPANLVFRMVWNLIKWFFDKMTRNKLILYADAKEA